MSQNGPATPPGPPVPDPHARRGVRWTIIGIVISTVIALVSLYFQAQQSKGDSADPPTPGSSTPAEPVPTPDDESPSSDPPSPTPDDSGPDDSSPTPYSGDDGLTLAEHDLRDSLNTDQWSRDSCSHTVWQGATAALYCTVTTVDQFGVTGTGKASVVMYETKTDRDSVFQTYAGNMPEGNCEAQINVRGSWSENNTGQAAGDVVCFLSTTGQYVFLCSYYDRPALVQITGPDQNSLTAWWHTMEPVFTD
ncbi:hypothetical protein [Streptomyces griseoruber]|uniref:Uncharacterized protein n=1 Tax=Streptomyces griseoruber TaxID=1943 RepID=A0A117RAH6_9ACTN|nr:hypothetical protein [Streptomyces griseoruber]KUN80006.1 hypothetical protein AQJ64_26675 [Streptomyces griseoruber]